MFSMGFLKLGLLVHILGGVFMLMDKEAFETKETPDDAV